MGRKEDLHLDLSEDGFDGQWVDMADIGAMSPEQFEDIKIKAESGDGSSIREFFALSLKAWHILDPKTGASLPPPSSAEWDLRQIPMRINKRIQESIAQQVEDVLPKVSRSA